MSKPQVFDAIIWQDVPQEACRLAKAAAGPYCVIRDLMPALPQIHAKVWYNPDRECAFMSYPIGVDTDKVASWHIALRQVPGVESIEHGYFSVPPETESYILVKKATNNESIFGPIASAAQFKPNALNNLWGGPNPLAATIGGGLLGAGLGYGAGWLGEQLLPESVFERGKLRRTMSVMGGLAGAAPGIWNGFDQQFRGPTENQGLGAWVRPFPWVKQNNDNRFEIIKEGMVSVFPHAALELNELWIKAADEAGGAFSGMIPVDQFGRTIWNDLRGQGGFTPAPIAAATTGLMQAASLSQGGANLISPMDIARIGMGMGTGYVSSLLVGKTLGALAGLRPEAQQSLQNTGVWAGILANTIPLAF